MKSEIITGFYKIVVNIYAISRQFYTKFTTWMKLKCLVIAKSIVSSLTFIQQTYWYINGFKTIFFMLYSFLI